MVDRRLARGIRIALLDGFQDAPHLDRAEARAARHRHRPAAQVVDPRVQPLQHLGDDRIAAALQDHVVEAAGRGDQADRIGRGHGLVEFDQGLAHPRDLVVGGMTRHQRGGLLLQDRAHLVDLARLLPGDLGDGRPLVGRDGDELLGLQRAQRLAHRRAADTQQRTEIGFDQPFARLEQPGQNPFAQLGRGLPLDGDMHHPHVGMCAGAVGHVHFSCLESGKSGRVAGPGCGTGILFTMYYNSSVRRFPGHFIRKITLLLRMGRRFRDSCGYLVDFPANLLEQARVHVGEIR